MTGCERFQPQLLDYLYDLLDDREHGDLEAHLSGCEPCQAALKRARQQKQLVAAAAKAEFPAVRFEPPHAAVTVPHEGRPAVESGIGWRLLALAACILLVIGLSVPAGVFGVRWFRVERQLAVANLQVAEGMALRAELEARTKLELDQAHKAAEESQTALASLQAEQRAKSEELMKKAIERQLTVVVSGPEVLQPGARNDYQIHTLNLNNQVLTASLSARVLDENRKVLFEANDIKSDGNYRLSLPADLPLRPDSKLSLEVVARRDGSPEQKIQQVLALAAPVYFTHLTTDKPMYRPGETVHFRSLSVERFSLKPAAEELRLNYQITNSQGQEIFRLAGSPQVVREGSQSIAGPDGKAIKGVGAGEFKIDAQARGGEYTLTVREEGNRFPEQQRKFIVNQYENPRINKELDFNRKSYGPGDDVVAACKANKAEGGAVSNQPVTAEVFIDGKPYGADGSEGRKPISLRTDALGQVRVAFKLPRAIERGQATLSVQFTDGASVEAISKPIPIALKRLQVEFFPESGDLIASLPNRIYFQAKTLLGKPAELKGRIVDFSGRTVVDGVQTLNDDKEPGVNQGMGLFAFTPRAGERYELKIDSPVNIEGRYPLPEAKDNGITLQIPTGVTSASGTIRVIVHSAGKDRRLLVGAYCRGRLLDHQSLVATSNQASQVELRPSQGVGGVYRVTVFEEINNGTTRQLMPRAERLIFRSATDQLILKTTPDRKQYMPGEKVRLRVEALNEKEEAAPAIVMVGVVDKSVIKLADEKTYRTMSTHYFLTTEVRKPEELEYADFMLTSHPKAAPTLDLLLGTQGWRRFAEQNPNDFREKFKEDADRLLLAMGRASERATDLAQQEFDALDREYHEKARPLDLKVRQSSIALEAARAGNKLKDETAAAIATLAHARVVQDTALKAKQQLFEALGSIRPIILWGGMGLLAIALVVCVVRGRSARASASPRYLLLAALCLVVLVSLVVMMMDPLSASKLAMETRTFDQVGANTNAPAVDNVFFGDRGKVDRAAPQPKMAAPMPMEARGLERAEPMDRMGGAMKAEKDAFAGAPAARGRPADAPNEATRFNLAVPGNAPAAAAIAAKPEDRAAAVMEMKKADPGAINNLLRLEAEPRRMNVPNGDGAQANKKLDLLQQVELEKGLKQQAAMGAVRLVDQNRMAAGAAGGPPVDPIRRGGMGLGNGGIGGGIGGIGGGIGGGAPGQPGFGGGGGAGFGRGFGGMPGGGPAGPPAAGGQGLPYRRIQLPAQPPPPLPPLMVREYAHFRPTATPVEQRTDFVDTVYWHPVLVLPDGKAEVAFDLCDSVTSYQVTAFGHTLDGRIGSLISSFEARLPFTLEPKLPIEVTAGDIIDVPVSVANNTTEDRPVQLRVFPENLSLVDGKAEDYLSLLPEARGRKIVRLKPSILEGKGSVRLEGRSDPFTDSVTRSFGIVPQGFPVMKSHSDMLEGIAQSEVLLPEGWIKGTLKCQVNVYPSTLADLQKGLEGLLREPHGCFEQTSTSNYPNVLILDYLRQSNQANNDVESRTRNLLTNGYAKLVSFECQDTAANRRRGYEWFGGTTPPHEALTAYGLLQFRDMARVHDVDQAMVERTRQYLLSRKDGKGGFQRNARALDTFGRAPDNITNAYIVWALTESSKDDDVDRELAALAEQAGTSKDPYFLSLVGTSLLNRGRTGEGLALLKSVAAVQKEDGHLEAGSTSITGSRGRDLQVETTALATLGWVKANRPADFNVAIQKAIKWIGQQRGGHGAFGSTQSTILALKAIIAYTQANKKTAESGEIRVQVGKEVLGRLPFAAGAEQALTIELAEPEKHLKTGKNPVQIEITGKNTFPFTLTWAYQVEKPAGAEGCPVRIGTKLDRKTADEGETVHLTVTVENAEDKGQGMAVAIIGLPAGSTLPEDMKQLKDHALLRDEGKERGLISAFETRGRELILYWRDLAPKQKIEVPLDLICRVPGEYRGPASRSYLYYNADLKHWIDPLDIAIKAKRE